MLLAFIVGAIPQVVVVIVHRIPPGPREHWVGCRIFKASGVTIYRKKTRGFKKRNYLYFCAVNSYLDVLKVPQRRQIFIGTT